MADLTSERALMEALSHADIYDHPVEHVEVVQTHISWVFLAGEYVYKVKKPVDFGFLDFSTLRKRRYYCHQEVALNSRLCPEIYLGVVPIRNHNGRFTLGGEHGRIVEYAVRMHRLPEDRMLDHLLELDGVDREVIARIAVKLAQFHEECATGPEINRFGSVRSIRRNWQENFDQTAPFVGKTISELQFGYLKAWVEATMRCLRGLFKQRVDAGRVRDGHGDLRASAICLTDEICIFDCIEFNKRFRYADVAADVAFLVMDLAAKGHPELADHFVDSYVSASGDTGLRQIIDFYTCYRAFVRGKVEGFLVEDESATESERADAAATARDRFALAVDAARRSQPLVVLLTCGLSGSGKTTVAASLANRTGFRHISSDRVRKDLAGIEHEEHATAGYGEGIYTPVFSRRTYREMLQRARTSIASGTSVILDATFSSASSRDAAFRMAREEGAMFICLECRASESEARLRLDRRESEGNDPSDATWATYLEQRDHFDAVTEFSGWSHIVLDTSGLLSDVLEAAGEALGSRLEPPGLPQDEQAMRTGG